MGVYGSPDLTNHCQIDNTVKLKEFLKLKRKVILWLVIEMFLVWCCGSSIGYGIWWIFILPMIMPWVIIKHLQDKIKKLIEGGEI